MYIYISYIYIIYIYIYIYVYIIICMYHIYIHIILMYIKQQWIRLVFHHGSPKPTQRWTPPLESLETVKDV